MTEGEGISYIRPTEVRRYDNSSSLVSKVYAMRVRFCSEVCNSSATVACRPNTSQLNCGKTVEQKDDLVSNKHVDTHTKYVFKLEKEERDDLSCYIMSGRIADIDVKCSLDTLRKQSVISKHVFDRLPRELKTQLTPSHDKKIVVNGATLQVFGNIVLSCKIQGIAFRESFTVSNINNDVTIGMHFLEQNSCSLDFSRSVLYLKQIHGVDQFDTIRASNIQEISEDKTDVLSCEAGKNSVNDFTLPNEQAEANQKINTKSLPVDAVDSVLKDVGTSMNNHLEKQSVLKIDVKSHIEPEDCTNNTKLNKGMTESVMCDVPSDYARQHEQIENCWTHNSSASSLTQYNKLNDSHKRKSVPIVTSHKSINPQAEINNSKVVRKCHPNQFSTANKIAAPHVQRVWQPKHQIPYITRKCWHKIVNNELTCRVTDREHNSNAAWPDFRLQSECRRTNHDY